MKHRLALALIFVLALLVRLYGLNWDQGQHLHPDERFLTMYINDISLPHSLSQYLSLDSPLNPYNYDQYKFFVYGTFPTTLVTVISYILNLNSYFYINLVGRGLSALFDSFNIILLFYFFKLILNNNKKALLPSLIYATSVLPIQLSHFFAVDTFLNTFIFASFTFLLYWLYKRGFIYLLLSGVSLGLALSSKISAGLFTPILILIFLFQLWKYKNIKLTIFSGFLFSFFTFFIVKIASPYYFSTLLRLNPDFVNSLKTLSSFNNQFFPPAVQWLSKTNFIFPLINLSIWSLGIPVSAMFLLSVKKMFLRLNIPIFLSAVWVFSLFIFQSSQFSYAQRYYLIIIPSIIILFSYFLLNTPKKLTLVFFVFHFFYLLAFLNVYRLPHSRIRASAWIYQNIPFDSVLSCEHWDDCLPLPLKGQHANYQITSLELFSQDTPDKWPQIYQNLTSVDYLIMSSNRLWASIPKVPDIYPQTTLFYQQLFKGQPLFDSDISFTKIAQFNNYPGFHLPFIKQCFYIGPSDYPGIQNKWFEVDKQCFYPGVYFRDDTADESFTVYDHPQVLIFEKK